MISVLNHLRRLNGSKIVFLLSLIIFLASCSGSKRTTKKTRTPNKKPRVETPVEDKDDDTDVVKEDRDKRDEDKTEDRDKQEEKLDAIVKEEVYDLTFLAPFDGRRNLQSDPNDRFLQYYAGMRMAADDLTKNGANVRVNMVDTENRRINNVLNQEVLESTDVIIGPYDRNDLKYAIDYAHRKKIPLVSPWQSLNSLSKPSPYYVQLSPYLTEYYHKMIEHISDNYRAEDVIIVGRRSVKSDQKRIEGFQQLAAAYFKNGDKRPLKVVNAEMGALGDENAVFRDYLNNRGKTVVIIPNWSGEDYDYMYNVLRRLSLEKGQRTVVVYGMFAMMNNPNINYELWRGLNLHVVAKNLVDEESYGVKKFRRDFLNRYGTIPSNDAYEGYDDFFFITKSLHKYGKNFQFYLEKETDPLIHSQFRIFRNMEDIESSKPEDIRFFENKHIDIVKMGELGYERIK